ncbi:MAG: hypothetical protein OEW23_05575 [Candidatus Aminicenantes bacterium]|nr:hypothetical protein [Candidatus Aminicenantes bacterium]
MTKLRSEELQGWNIDLVYIIEQNSPISHFTKNEECLGQRLEKSHAVNFADLIGHHYFFYIPGGEIRLENELIPVVNSGKYMIRYRALPLKKAAQSSEYSPIKLALPIWITLRKKSEG